jgi:hypothetical protein
MFECNTENSQGLVRPESNQRRLVEGLRWSAEQNSLDDAAEVAQVESVMTLLRSRQQSLINRVIGKPCFVTCGGSVNMYVSTFIAARYVSNVASTTASPDDFTSVGNAKPSMNNVRTHFYKMYGIIIRILHTYIPWKCQLTIVEKILFRVASSNSAKHSRLKWRKKRGVTPLRPPPV